jgi:hypothetical protein
MTIYRQGDVLLKKIEAVPHGAKQIEAKTNSNILAEGEVTGHAHAISALATSLWLLDKHRYLKVAEETPLVHQEHGPIAIPIGDYEVIVQREYTPMEIRNVTD